MILTRAHRVALGTLCLLAAVGVAGAAGPEFEAHLSRAQAVPAAGPGAVEDAVVHVRFAEDLSSLEVRLDIEGGANVLAAHFHCARAGATGPVAFGLFEPGPLEFDGATAAGVLDNGAATGADCVPTIGRPVTNVAALALAMRDGLIYVNVHTTDNPPGEVRGQLLETSRPPFGRGRPDDVGHR